MDLAPDAAWGAARVESWCALALDKEGEREGAVAVVRRQLAAHPDDIDVNVVDPRARGGWTALLIAWCVTPRPPFNLSSNNNVSGVLHLPPAILQCTSPECHCIPPPPTSPEC